MYCEFHTYKNFPNICINIAAVDIYLSKIIIKK